jgi:hypothetical protein
MRDMPSRHRTNSQMAVFFLLLPFPAPPVGKKQALPSLRERKKFV